MLKLGKVDLHVCLGRKSSRVMMHFVIGFKLELSGYFKSIFFVTFVEKNLVFVAVAGL